MKSKIVLFIALFFAILSCVDPYDPGLVGKDKKIVVDCQITDRPDFIKLQLTYSAGYNSKEGVFDTFAFNGNVTIRDDKGKVFDFQEDERKTGLYVSTVPIKAEVGRAYTLQIKINGKTYTSTAEKLLPVADITRITSKYEKNTGIKPPAIGRFDLFVDTKDPAERTDFYRWTWKHYDRLTYCKVARQAGGGGEANPPFEGFFCCSPCWSVEPCIGCIYIASDAFANGSLIARQSIGSVPYDSRDPYYIVIEQQSLSRDAYTYWKTVKDQSSNSGGIFDAPPTFIKGNMTNPTDKNEIVLGFFSVSSVATKAFYLDRSQTFEPFGTVQVRAPTVFSANCEVCREGPLRTNIKPEGWFDLGGRL